MKKRFGSFLLAILVLNGSFSAEASGYRCQAVLRPTLGEVLVRIDKAYKGSLFNEDFQSFQETLSVAQKRKLRKILNNTYMGNLISHADVIRFADDLGLVLFGRRVVADNYILKSKRERAKEMTEGLINEKILRRGLLKAWGSYSPEKTGVFDVLVKGLRWSNDKARVMLSSRTVAVLKFPVLLSKINNQIISDQLMRKVVLEGFDKHADEAMLELKAQSRIDVYEAFRRIYNPVMLTSVTAVLTAIAVLLVQENNDRIISEQLSDLDQVTRELEKIPALRSEIIESKVESARQDFIKEWGEEPTAAEEAELRAKVVNGIKNKLKEQSGR